MQNRILFIANFFYTSKGAFIKLFVSAEGAVHHDDIFG